MIQYLVDAMKLSPLWVGAIFLFASQAPGEMFGDEWRDAAAMFAMYVLMGAIPAVLVIRLLMFFSQRGQHHQQPY